MSSFVVIAEHEGRSVEKSRHRARAKAEHKARAWSLLYGDGWSVRVEKDGQVVFVAEGET